VRSPAEGDRGDAPPQPMVTQTRAVLDHYAEAGGSCTEVVIAGAGHSPHLEAHEEFATALHKGLIARP
jgi:pimeloyl-ACP methyl ester carboxylesterase